MEALYHQTNNLVQGTQDWFLRLEKCNETDAVVVEREIQGRIDTITSNCERLDLLVFKEPIGRRQSARTRVDQLKYDNQHLQAALRALQHRRSRREQEAYDREKLLNSRFTSLDDSDTAILIDHGLNHNSALQRANRGMDDLILSGGTVIDNLRDQRATLKGTQRRLLDAANTLGLSNTTMRLIENRVRQDKWILFGGMAITLLVILGVVVYIRK